MTRRLYDVSDCKNCGASLVVVRTLFYNRRSELIKCCRNTLWQFTRKNKNSRIIRVKYVGVYLDDLEYKKNKRVKG